MHATSSFQDILNIIFFTPSLKLDKSGLIDCSWINYQSPFVLADLGRSWKVKWRCVGKLRRRREF